MTISCNLYAPKPNLIALLVHLEELEEDDFAGRILN